MRTTARLLAPCAALAMAVACASGPPQAPGAARADEIAAPAPGPLVGAGLARARPAGAGLARRAGVKQPWAPRRGLAALPSPRATSAGDGPRSRWRGRVSRLRGALRNEVRERNWHPGCPVPIRDLRALTVTYWGFDGEIHEGPLVVNERVAEDVLGVFRRLFHAEFAIKHIALARRYRPNADLWNTTRNTTSAFNCRPVTDIPGSLSQHSYGWAIDINPLQNPYVRADGSVLRRAAKPYRDRSRDRPGMIHPGDVVVRSFARIGWAWGGDFDTIADYMHFSLTGG